MVARVLILIVLVMPLYGASPRGFHFAEGITHTVIPFTLYKNLIVIPAQLNDSVKLKLILDTGARSVLLFGKRFRGLSTLLPGKLIQVSGWGAAGTIEANMAHPNKVEIGAIQGHELNIAVAPHRRFLDGVTDIDGVIGYELFVRFVVEINYPNRTIHLYDRLTTRQARGFQMVPIEINQARPEIHSTIQLRNRREIQLKLLVDTGSSLGLTLFSADVELFTKSSESNTIGIGLAGRVTGFELFVNHLLLGSLKVEPRKAYLVNVDHHPDDAFELAGSLGAQFWKDHIVIFDYPRSKMLLKKIG